jgi:hypothetical protein
MRDRSGTSWQGAQDSAASDESRTGLFHLTWGRPLWELRETLADDFRHLTSSQEGFAQCVCSDLEN